MDNKKALQRQRECWPDKSDEWLFERLSNELKQKVDEIHRLIEEKPYTESDLVSFGNFLLADRGEGNYLMSKKHVTHADLENWKNGFNG